MKISFSEDNMLPLTPYSCCKKDSVCYGNSMGQKEVQNWVKLPPTINMTLINEEGCLRLFSETLDEICVFIFIVVGIVFLLQVKRESAFQEFQENLISSLFPDFNINLDGDLNAQEID